MTMNALFTNRATDGSSDPIKVASLFDESEFGVPVGEHVTVMATGTFNSATIKLQIGPTSSGPWVDSTEATFTAAGAAVTPLSAQAWVRATVTGTGSPAPSLSMYVG